MDKTAFSRDLTQDNLITNHPLTYKTKTKDNEMVNLLLVKWQQLQHPKI